MLKQWTTPPVGEITKVYIFNYTNIENVTKGIEKVIKLQEVGPYVYLEYSSKINLTFQDHKITFFVSI